MNQILKNPEKYTIEEIIHYLNRRADKLKPSIIKNLVAGSMKLTNPLFF